MKHHPSIIECKFDSTPGMLSIRQKWGRDWLVGLDGNNPFVKSSNTILGIGFLLHRKKAGVWVFRFFYGDHRLEVKGTMEDALLAVQKKWNTLDDKTTID